jgi:hypothetical protein
MWLQYDRSKILREAPRRSRQFLAVKSRASAQAEGEGELRDLRPVRPVAVAQGLPL